MDVTEPTPDKGTEGSAAGPVPSEHHPSAEAPVQKEEGQVREVEKAIDGGEAATNVVSRIYVYTVTRQHVFVFLSFVYGLTFGAICIFIILYLN